MTLGNVAESIWFVFGVACYVIQADLELRTLRTLPSECWDGLCHYG